MIFHSAHSPSDDSCRRLLSYRFPMLSLAHKSVSRSNKFRILSRRCRENVCILSHIFDVGKTVCGLLKHMHHCVCVGGGDVCVYMFVECVFGIYVC